MLITMNFAETPYLFWSGKIMDPFFEVCLSGRFLEVLEKCEFVLTDYLIWKSAFGRSKSPWGIFENPCSIKDRTKSIIPLKKSRRFWERAVSPCGNGVATVGCEQRKVNRDAVQIRNGGFPTRNCFAIKMRDFSPFAANCSGAEPQTLLNFFFRCQPICTGLGQYAALLGKWMRCPWNLLNSIWSAPASAKCPSATTTL